MWGGLGEIYQWAAPDLLSHQDALRCLRAFQPPFPQFIAMHRSPNSDHPRAAWLAMASDLTAAGFEEEARQCVRKATGLPAHAQEVNRVLSRLRAM